MRWLAGVLVVVALAGCSSSSDDAAPTTTVAPTTPPTTLDPSVSQVCRTTVSALADAVDDPTDVDAYRADGPSEILGQSLSDCRDRIEWLLGMSEATGAEQSGLSAVFAFGCRLQEFVAEGMNAIDGSGSIAVACRNA